MTKTRVLLFDHNTDMAGGQKSLLALIDSIDRASFELFAVAPYQARTMIKELQARSVTVEYLPLNARGDAAKNPFRRACGILAGMWRLCASIAQIVIVCHRSKIDVVHANTIGAALIAGVACMMARTKLAVRIRSGLVYSNHGLLDYLVFALADLMLCNSHYVRDTIAVRLSSAPAWFRNKTLAKSYVVYNPIPWPAIRSARRHAINAGKPLQLQNGKFNLGVVGRITQRKQQHVAIDAMAQLAGEGVDAHLWVIGDPSPIDGGRYAKEMAARVRELGLCSHVTFTGFIGDAYAWLTGLDVVVMPSIAEPLARTVFEAQAMGTAVIAADDAGNAELITHQENGLLFAPGDVSGLVGAIKHAGRRQTRARLEWRALMRTVRRFTPQVTVNCEAALLRGCVTAKSPQASAPAPQTAILASES